MSSKLAADSGTPKVPSKLSAPAKSSQPPKFRINPPEPEKPSNSSKPQTKAGGSLSSSTSLPDSKRTLKRCSSSSTTHQNMEFDYKRVEKDPSPLYRVPEDIEHLIKNDIVPPVLKRPLSPATYSDYFNALLYAEDYYIEKWSNFLMEKVRLQLEDTKIRKRGEEIHKILVAFEVDSVRERRPFLLSRDFVFAKLVGMQAKLFQGVIYRVVKSTKILVEFEDDFYSQHDSGHKYDVSFSFNRVCLKRAHQAIEAASDPMFQSLTFPDQIPSECISVSAEYSSNQNLSSDQNFAVHRMLSFGASPPFLVDGPLTVRQNATDLSKTGEVVQEAVVNLYHRSPEVKILICAPINNTLDVLLRSLSRSIPANDIFRANAAFREIERVPGDILSSCLYDEEYFNCPPFHELKEYRIILTTVMSSFRLRNEGLRAGHFSHIFLVDASSAPEPEIMVALANLANEATGVIITGNSNDRPGWIRSDIARANGLRVSYFERLCRSKPYNGSAIKFICHVKDEDKDNASNPSSF